MFLELYRSGWRRLDKFPFTKEFVLNKINYHTNPRWEFVIYKLKPFHTIIIDEATFEKCLAEFKPHLEISPKKFKEEFERGFRVNIDGTGIYLKTMKQLNPFEKEKMKQEL